MKKLYRCMECRYQSYGTMESKIFITFSNKKALCESCVDLATLVILHKRLENLERVAKNENSTKTKARKKNSQA